MAIITTSIERCTGNLSRHSETKKDINVVKEETDGQRNHYPRDTYTLLFSVVLFTTT